MRWKCYTHVTWETPKQMRPPRLTADVLQWVLRYLQISIKLNALFGRCSQPPYLPEHAPSDFVPEMFRFCGLITLLGDVLHPTGLALFSYTVKSHYLFHVALISQYQNPLLGGCFQGEQMMQVVKKLAASCARGNSEVRVSNAAMEK